MKTSRPAAVLLKGDPELSFKRKVMRFLERDVILSGGKEAVECELLDLSSFEKLPKDSFLHLAPGADKILLSPLVLSDLSSLRLTEPFHSKIAVAHPLRAWGIVEKIKNFSRANLGGELTSFRIIWNLPKSRSHTAKEFIRHSLPDFLDLARFISGKKVVRVQLERSAGNAVFGLVVLEDNVVCELDVSETGPKSLAPVRFVHAYFQKGVVSNLPLFGHTNTEGLLVADDLKSELRVAEHGEWEGSDEIEDFYLRMIAGILDGTYVSRIDPHFSSDQKACAEAWKSGEPVEILQEN